MGHTLTWITLALAILSLFVFPALITFSLLVILAFFIPPASVVLGIAYDALYYSGIPHGWPLGTSIGVLSFACGMVVRRFVKTRIMES